MPRPVIAIFVHQPDLTHYEEISLTQCARVLGTHPMRLICPEGMDVSAYLKLAPQLVVDEVPASCLSSLSAYNKLKMSPWIYDRYREYDFMLTYELDAFVFRDDLLEWCEAGWDYIGAPWFRGFDDALPDAAILIGGNSGLSLRRIETARRLTRRWKLIRPMHHIYRDWLRGTRGRKRSYRELCELAVKGNTFHHRYSPADMNEDIYWSKHAPRRFPKFRMAPYEVARRFSFETSVVRLLEECDGELPFGCHKWQTIRLDFWRPYIRACGYEV